ncbi:predicted protein [Postia placenta Mad-698-R]|uniref:Uncharacterized protein n=2 Tax=Rhodonia placenta TaxID=104341 RepID=A0A1X6NE35_9APHY|nr:hypothetical protein POSPLADRAFT_1129720 [Postia placenta MAD-698-R-SB12]EED80337.1 predicted protein [Postia placenta Mad-698-R]KAF9820746.1 hypothetical protein IEO21_01189 [Postia placenta]OSX66834.1 hypothetical protein POSPLADRAFT_1129720 [Postia placenta MAD-698-R-SB12]
MSSGAMQSKVGNPQVYNDGDQRPHGTEAPPRYEAGQQHAHNIFDPQDDQTLDNRRQREEKRERDADRKAESKTVTNPLEPATRQGHKPSRGAQVDAELQEEDEAALEKKKQQKGSFGPTKGMT